MRILGSLRKRLSFWAAVPLKDIVESHHTDRTTSGLPPGRSAYIQRFFLSRTTFPHTASWLVTGMSAYFRFNGWSMHWAPMRFT